MMEKSKVSRWEHLKPYLVSMKAPFKAVWQDSLGRVGSLIFLMIILIAIFAPQLATHDPNVMNERIEGSFAPYIDGAWGRVNVVGTQVLNSTSILDSGAGVAVGQEGSILMWQDINQNWQKVETTITEHLYGVSLFNENLGFAVGEGGIILKYDGRNWYSISSPTDENLLAVAFANGDYALAVGANGTLIKWEDNEWTELASGVTHNLNDVNLLANGEGIIVGNRGTIIMYDNGELSSAAMRSFLDATFRNLNGVAFYDQSLAITVGERGTILQFDGEVWFTVTSPDSREFRNVAIKNPQEAYAAGRQGIIIAFDGENWRRIPTQYRRHFRDIEFAGDLGVAVGTDPYINELAPPTRDHYFGTTHLGRDIFSQVMYGTRTALMVGIIAALVVSILGFSVGLVAGYFRGKTDSILMRIVDIMYALPLEPFAIILVMIFRPSLWIIILAIGLLTWRTNARVIRSQVLSIVQRPFIKAAKVAGAGNIRILLVHIAPNVLPLAFLQLAVAMGYAITAEATLSFLGLGPPQVYSWGTILHSARLSGAWRTAWWWVLPPGVFITLTVVSVFLISRSLEVITNPRLRGGK